MTFVLNYNKEIHDLYNYDSEPVLNWQENIFKWAKPVSFNPNLYLNSITDYIPGSTLPMNLDFSGIVARKRGAALYYGSGKPLAEQIGYFNGFGTTMGNFIPSLQSPLNGNNTELTRALMDDGWCGAYNDILNDYNHWNPGDIPGCLISPAHVLVGGHMIDPLWGYMSAQPLYSPNGLSGFNEGEIGDVGAPYIKLRFVGTGNTYYEKLAVLSFFLNGTFSNGFCGNLVAGPSYENYFCQDDVETLGLTFEDAKDLAILELRDPNDPNTCLPLSSDELKHVKIYKIGNLRTWPGGSPLFLVNPQGVVLVRRKSPNPETISQGLPYFTDLTNLNLPQIGYVQLDGLGGKTDVIFDDFVWYGDSCNFLYGYYPPTQETVFLASVNTGSGEFFSFDTINRLYDYEFLKSLKQWIYDRIYNATGTGYYIDWIDYSNSTETISSNDKEYPLISKLSAGTTQTFLGGLTIPNSQFGFTAGITYSFAVTSVNITGFSGFAGPINTRIT